MSYLYGNGGGVSGGVLAIHDEERGVLFRAPGGAGVYHLRSRETSRAQSPGPLLWPRSRMLSGDPSVPLAALGIEEMSGAAFEAFQDCDGGKNRYWYLRGTCVDEIGNPLGGATVQAFVTAGDIFAGEIACDDRGVYEVPTPWSGSPHYLVAYYPGSPDKAGTSVNTLMPSL